jgi:peptide/nickel transport system permease protein
LTPAAVPTPPASSTGKFLARFAGNWSLSIGTSVIAIVLVAAVFAPLIAPHDPYLQNVSNRLMNPVWYSDGSWTHPLGTDNLGRDYLSRLIYGARVSLGIGFFAMVISGIVGAVLGISAGYFGGRVDAAVMYLVTVRMSLPLIILALATVAAVGASLTVIVLLLGLFLWDRFAIVLRAATQQVRSADYVTAARALGCSHLYIMAREILPNVFPHFIVVATLEVANAILLESALSFLGVGVQPPTPSWGMMISEGRQFMFFKGWIIAVPGVALFILILAVNMTGDGLRKFLLPQGRET